MTVATPEHLVTCMPLGYRFVVHKHEITQGVAELLEAHLKRKFDWLQSVWADHDPFRQFVVKFYPDESYPDRSVERRVQQCQELINSTLEFITWTPSTTRIIYDIF